MTASQGWLPSPNYGFVYTTVRKNGQVWNDTSPYFYAATYVQLDGVATGQGYDMIGGHFRGGQFYTRTTKLVTGSPTDPASASFGVADGRSVHERPVDAVELPHPSPSHTP